MKRYLSIWFPDWPLIRLARSGRTIVPDTVPFVLVESGAHGLVVAAANASARAMGVEPGLRFADAKARAPSLASYEIDRQADETALSHLSRWMIRVAPIVAHDGVDALMIETTGCERYYGGEAALAQHAEQLLLRRGLPHQWAMAGTPGAAAALARYRPGTIAPQGEERQALHDLPMAGLGLSAAALTLLRRLGLTRIGQLYGIDRRALGRRFRASSDAVVLRLDQVLGRRPDPLIPVIPPPTFAARLPCPDPLLSSEGVAHGMKKLADDLCTQLNDCGQGARLFTLYGFRSDGTKAALVVRAARPMAAPAHLAYLFSERIDRLDPGFGIDLLWLYADRVSALQDSVPVLSRTMAGPDSDQEGLAILVDRLQARLGEGSVSISTHIESHIPERAEAYHAYDAGNFIRTRRKSAGGPRPQRLIEPPERVSVMAEIPDGPPRSFRWRRVVRRVVRADGPERLSPEWWRHIAPPQTSAAPAEINRFWLAPKMDPPADAEKIAEVRTQIERALAAEASLALPAHIHPRARDYYRVEDQKGRRYWIFREGLYENDRGRPPEWFVHGLFS